MSRLGRNPLKDSRDLFRLKGVTCGLLTCVPELSGYWAGMQEIVEFCLLSMRLNTRVDHHVIVLDNGSCGEFRSFLGGLADAGLIDVLILSQGNLGKAGGINLLASMTQGRHFFYADSDLYFLPGWLEAHVDIAETFMRAGLQVGMVSGVPLPIVNPKPVEAYLRKHHPQVRIEPWKVPEWIIEEHASDIGKPPDRIARSWHPDSRRITVDGVTAHIGAWHMQFLMPASVARKVFPVPVTRPISGDDDRRIEQAVDAMHALRLSPVERVVRHVGNRMEPEFLPIYRDMKRKWLECQARRSARKSVGYRQPLWKRAIFWVRRQFA